MDNASISIGWEAGLATCLEEKPQRKIHTIGCSLHQNELPFRTLFKFLDGAFSGPLGNLYAGNHHSLPQAAFASIKGPLVKMTFEKEIVM